MEASLRRFSRRAPSVLRSARPASRVVASARGLPTEFISAGIGFYVAMSSLLSRLAGTLASTAPDRGSESSAGTRASSHHDQPADSEPAAPDLALYHYASCPFCVRVRRALSRLGVEVELRDVRKDRDHARELIEGGGKSQVPCLRIEREDGVEWMYESGDIVRYLESRFAA